MVILASPLSPTLTPAGRVDGLIVRRKFSLPSDILSLVITTSNETLVIPAANLTEYGPEL